MGIADIINKVPLITRLVGNQGLAKCMPFPFVLPFYHVVGDHNMPHISRLYQTRTIKDFERDLDYFGQQFEFSSYEDIETSSKKGRPKVLLSFDDGFRECYDVIRPILKRKGIPGIFFINTGYIDNHDLMYRCKASYISNTLTEAEFFPILLKNRKYKKKVSGYEDLINELLSLNFIHRGVLDDVILKFGLPIKTWLKDTQPYMSSSMIKEMSKEGFTIGAHSHTHPSFKDLNAVQQWDEVERSVDSVNTICETESCPFSFPFNDIGVSQLTLEKMDADQRISRTFGVSGFKSDVLTNHLHRVAMEDSGLDAEQRLKSECISYLIRKLIGKNRVKR